jgi:hypothetical protein
MNISAPGIEMEPVFPEPWETRTTGASPDAAASFFTGGGSARLGVILA